MANPSWSKAKQTARDVHLDKDAVGRPLEITSDRNPREMTVEMAHAIRQNPAYRPVASN